MTEPVAVSTSADSCLQLLGLDEWVGLGEEVGGATEPSLWCSDNRVLHTAWKDGGR